MRSDDPLSKRKSIRVQDLKGLPLFCSGQGWIHDIPAWAGDHMKDLVLEGSFRLVYNASIFAKEGLGYLLTFDGIIDTSEKSGLVFRPLTPALTTALYLVWNRYQTLTPIAERFLSEHKAGIIRYYTHLSPSHTFSDPGSCRSSCSFCLRAEKDLPRSPYISGRIPRRPPVSCSPRP